jgi:hypothetical protein
VSNLGTYSHESSGAYNYLPLIYQAQDIIRTSRNHRYFEGGDMLCTIWAQALAIGQNADQLSGTNLSALDKLFERARSSEELQIIFDTLQPLTAPEAAVKYLQSERDGMSLHEAVCLHIAYLTWEGYRRTSDVTAALARDWVSLWQSRIREQNIQQFEHTRVQLNARQYRPDASTFEAGVAGYLNRFGETGALSMAVLGAFPFSRYANRELLNGVMWLLDVFVPLFRLAQDVMYDPDEKLNSGIYALAAERQISVGEAYRQLKDGVIPTDDLEKRLQASFEKHLVEAQAAASYILSDYIYRESGRLLNDFSVAMLFVARTMTQPWKG